MKKIIIIGIILAAFAVQAQTTNITIRITVENSLTGTNVQTLKMTQGGTVADARRIDGLIWTYEQATVDHQQPPAVPVIKPLFEDWLFDTLVTQPVNTARDAKIASTDAGLAQLLRKKLADGTMTPADRTTLETILAKP